MKNRYTQPSHKGISTAHQRKNKKPHSTQRKYLREPLPKKLDTGWIMDYGINNLYIGGLQRNNHYLWSSTSIGKSAITAMYFNKIRGHWQVGEPKKDADSPFKKA